ncbi:hypothetical protein BH23PLA1_BH23PLA1_14140 [soil metagenome]
MTIARRSFQSLGMAFGLILTLSLSMVLAQAEAPAGASGSVIGSRNTKVYHDPDCGSVRRLLPQNRLVLPGLAVAEAQGFVACKTCKPNRILLASAVATPNAVAVQDDAKLSFTRDIAPVLVGNCVGCHNPQERRGGFDLSTFQQLMTGSETGQVIVPGKPEESELVLRIKGESTPKMPANNRDLAADTISRIERWVRDGAVLDAGVDPSALLRDVTVTPEALRKAELAKMSDEERDERLSDFARDRWRRAGETDAPEMISSPHFAFFGDLPEDRAERALKSMEGAYTWLKGLLSQPGKPALDWPEKVSLYVFNDAARYAEFVRSVQNQAVETGEQARANLGVEGPFVVVLDPHGGGEAPVPARAPSRRPGGAADEPTGPERGLDGLLAEQLGIATVSQEGRAPRWLAHGIGAYMVSQVEPRSPYINRLRAEAVQQYRIGWNTKATEALGDATDDQTLRALGFSLIEWMVNAYRPRFPMFVRGMLEGNNKLDEGVQALFGVDRSQFLQAWGGWVASRYGRGR